MCQVLETVGFLKGSDMLYSRPMTTTLLINSIYRATEGEGIHIGIPQIFVRFQGCHVGCVNCDTKETWDFDPAFTMALDEVMESIETLSQNIIKRVSITGGDP